MNNILQVSDIMKKELITATLDTPIFEIVNTMQDKKISSIVITKKNEPIGIITERDIVKASLSAEKNLKKIASELMSSPVFSMTKDVDYRDAYMQMKEHNIRHLIIVDDEGDLLGMLGERDFINHLSPEQLLAIKEVSQVMTEDVLSCGPDESAYVVLKKMAQCHVGGIIIEKENKALGMLSERDALELIKKSSRELEEPIKVYMNSPVVTIHKNQTVLNAQSMMEDLKIRRLVVVKDDNSIAGILSRHDLIKSIPEYYVEILREVILKQKKLISQTQMELDEETIFHNAMKSLPHNLVLMTSKDETIQFINRNDSHTCTEPKVEVGALLDSLDGELFDILKEDQWRKAVQEGEIVSKIVKVKNKDESFCYFNTTLSATLNSENEFEGYIYIARDISEQHNLEKELKRLNENIQEAYHVAKIGNWELDAKTLSAFWSDEICDIFGIPHNTKGSPYLLETLVEPEYFPLIKNSLMQALETGSSHQFVYKVFPQNGAEACWVECRGRRELDKEGNPKSLIGTLQDITPRVKAEQRIEHLNSLLKAIRNINQHIVKEKTIEPLMQSVCSEITQVEKFFGVWILLDTMNKNFYSTGFNEEVLQEFEDNILKGVMPACCQVRDKLQTYKTLPISCSNCPLADAYGENDTVVVPIIYENNFYGHIGLSIGVDFIEDQEEKDLLKELANDIAFSIYTINERERHKIELENSYEMLYKLTENVPGVIYQYQLYPDGRSRFPYATRGIGNIYEVSPEEVLHDATPVFDRLHKEDVESVVASINESAETMEEWNLEYRVNLPKKGTCWLHGRAIPETLDDGSILWHGIINDITEQKNLENELRLFKRSVESSNEGITITNANEDNTATYVNPAFERLTGYKPEEIIGKNLRLLNEKNREQTTLEKLRDAIEKKTSVQVELKNYRKDGSEFISKLTIDPIRDEHNKVTHFVGIQKDITEEHRVLNQLMLQSESLNKSHAGISMVNEKKLLTYANLAYIQMWGYESEEEILGTSPSLHCADPTLPEQVIKTVNEEGESTMEFRAKRKDGSLFDVLMSVKKIRDHDGNAYFLASSLDISRMKEDERSLRQSATVFENTTEGVMITDANSVIIDVNDAFSEITGRERSEAIGEKPSSLKSGRHNKAFYKNMWENINKNGSWQGEIWNRRKNGEVYPQWLNITSVKNKLGNIESFISVFSDITVLKETAEKLDFLAHHDHLTELPNRTLLNARLDHTMSIGKRNKTLTAVMFMDINNFKNINDSYGHTLGDELLVAVSKRIGTIMSEDDTLARIGGDEFIVARNHFNSPEEIVTFVRKIMSLFEKSFFIEEKEFWITLSIGISIAPHDGTSTEILIKNADTAMYEAKGDGKNTFKFYNEKMSAICFERILFENALKSAIQNNEFEVYYQPQEDLLHNEIIGFEALVRWNHPTLGTVSPNRFIPIAEETKMILPIGEFVLKQACQDIKQWHEEGLCDGRVAVNVSGVQLEYSDFADILKYVLTHDEVDPSMIEIEVTESMVMKNPERWISILEEIKRIGVGISIDDFGTGYSSLSYLRRLPADTLKIDRSFIQDTPNEQDACALVNAIINMAESLGMDTLAEGLETSEQREYLIQQGCKYAQGFLLSKPMSASETYKWLKEK